MVKNISLLSSLCESSRWCHYDTVQDQVYISEIEFRPKKASKLPLILDNFWNNLTLKEAGRQTVDKRSTFGAPLKSLGYNGSNELCGSSVASKLSVHEWDAYVNSILHCVLLGLNVELPAWRIL